MSQERLCFCCCYCALFAAVGAAQDFDFRSAGVGRAIPATPAVMRDLAERMLPVYQEDDPERYLANLSALQLVAGNYAAAYASRQSLRDGGASADAGTAGRAQPDTRHLRPRPGHRGDRSMPFAQAFTQAYRDVDPEAE